MRKLVNALAAMAFIMAIPVVGMSDFYVIEMGEKNPPIVSVLIYLCFFLMIPKILYSVYKFFADEDEYDWWEDDPYDER